MVFIKELKYWPLLPLEFMCHLSPLLNLKTCENLLYESIALMQRNLLRFLFLTLNTDNICKYSMCTLTQCYFCYLLYTNVHMITLVHIVNLNYFLIELLISDDGVFLSKIVNLSLSQAIYYFCFSRTQVVL